MVSINHDLLPNRGIIAIDVKSFFASVEAVKRGLHPLEAYVIVLSGRGRPGGLVLAASPRVKQEFGIKTGSREFEIPKSPKLVIVPPRMSLYLKVNSMIINILKQYVTDEELLIYSIDEMLLDVTASQSLFGDVETIAKRIQREIWQKLKLCTTIGIGPNPLMAKVCMDIEAKQNPNCFAHWTYADVPTKLQKITHMTDFWGIGKRTEKRLNNMGIYTIEGLANANLQQIKRALGVIGEQLYYHAHGIDYSILSERYIPKDTSYGNSQILMRDYSNQQEVEIVIREMADQVASRLRKDHVKAGVLHLTIGFSKNIPEKGFSHQIKINETNSTKRMAEISLGLFRKYYQQQPVRSIALSCGKIKPQDSLQLNLFEDPMRTINHEKLEYTIDKIRDRYGFASLIYGSSLLKGGTALARSQCIGGHQA